MLPTLEEVIEIIKAGDKKRGRELLANVLQADLENERGWLWMSALVDSDEERRKYLNRVLEINPDNQAAKRGLVRLDKKQVFSPQPASPPPAKPQPEPGVSLSARLTARQQEEPAQPKQADISPGDVSTSQAEPAPPPTKIPPTFQPQQIDPTQPETPGPAKPTPPEPEASSIPQPEQVDLLAQVDLSEAEVSEPSAETLLPAQIQPSTEDKTGDEIESEISIEDKVLAAWQQVEPRLPALVRPAFRHLAQYWETERGKTVIGLGLVGLLLTCAACIIFGLVFQPVIKQVPPTLAAIVGTQTPTPTFTPIPPTSTNTPTVTPTPTDTPTLTPTPTNTQVVFDTPTVTPTPSKTPTPTPQIVIVTVNNIEGYVDIQNVGYEPQDLAGWQLLSELDTQECLLAGVIQPGETLRIWALPANAAQGGYNCGFEQNIWSDTEPDAAILYNVNGVEVSRLD